MQRSRRLVLQLGALLLLGLLALAGRFAWVAVGTHDVSKTRMDRQSNRSEEIEARRGSLFDRHGRELASSIQTLRVEVLPKNLQQRAETPERLEPFLAEVADFLSPLVAAPRDDLIRRLSGTKWTTLGKPVADPFALDELERERRGLLYGVDFRPGFQRRYPWGSAAGNVIGYVSHESVGVAGIEAGLDDMLAGIDGVRRFRVDHLGREVADRTAVEVPAVDGLDVTLTLDARLQQILEEEALVAMNSTDAEGVTVVAMDPRTGDVLGMCSVPGLDLSDRTDRSKEGSVCAALQEVYPPGSTFKPLMMAAALELGLAHLDGPPLDCREFLGPRSIRDTHPSSEPLDLEEIIVHSSNIGMANLLTRLVPLDRAHDYALMRPMYELLGRLGLGRRTGLPVPAEVPGLVTPLHRWSRNYTLASVAFGQELGVSATQMAAAASTLLDGLYRPPRLVHGLTDGEGVSLKIPSTSGVHVFRPENVRRIRGFMARSVDEGTCAEMRIPGIPVAGKTGTAQCETKKGAEVHSYVALAPADDPSLTLVVVVREPQGVRYASQSAAPAAGRILRRLLPYLGFSLADEE